MSSLSEQEIIEISRSAYFEPGFGLDVKGRVVCAERAEKLAAKLFPEGGSEFTEMGLSLAVHPRDGTHPNRLMIEPSDKRYITRVSCIYDWAKYIFRDADEANEDDEDVEVMIFHSDRVSLESAPKEVREFLDRYSENTVFVCRGADGFLTFLRELGEVTRSG
jgi:hypothetical protein